MAYQVTDEDGARPGRPEVTEVDSDKSRPSVSTNGWLGADQSLPKRDRSAGHSPVYSMQGVSFSHTNVNPILSSSSGTMSGFGQSDSGETNEASTSPDGGLSNRPTPNSSTASEQRSSLAPGRMNSSGRNSFDASPVSSHQNLTGQSEMERNAGPYFSDVVNGFTMGTGLTPMMSSGTTPGNEFSVPQGWEMPGQTGMTPVSEGVLRTIMQMGPMETMDLGWDTNP